MTKLRAIFSAFLVFAVTIVGCAQDMKSHEMTINDLKHEMKSDTNLVILDVRTPEELTGPLGHIDGVINIPVQVIESRVGELEQYRDKNIAVICRSGNRSGRATKFLLEKGFKVTNVLGGMKAWNAASK